MNRQSETDRELLARFGLPDTAGPTDIDGAHADVVAFLESAPHDLRAWARNQIAAADQVYALLSNPAAALDDSRRDPLEERRDQASAKSRRRIQSARQLTGAALPARERRRIGPLGRVLVAVAALVGTVGIVYVVYASDAPTVPSLDGTFTPENAAPTLDTARVGQLMARIQDDPNDVAALQELGDLYFVVGDYRVASDWDQKVLDIDPDNATAHLALGAAAYNLGDNETAEEQWRAVLALDAQNIEAHYDLGLMYFSATPPDVEQTIAEWQKVIDIAPGSDLAQYVSAHLPTLEQWQGSATGAPSAAPSPTRPAGASPAPSGTP